MDEEDRERGLLP